MEVAAEPENDEKSQSLWEKFLSDAAKSSTKHTTATMIVCGNNENPFPDIIHSMKSSSSKMGRPEEQLPYFLNYRYVDADSEIEEALHLHTWTVQDVNHYEHIPTVVPENHIASGRLGYILCIDTSRPSTMKNQFQKWTAFINKAQEHVLKQVEENTVQDLKDAVSKRIQFFQVSGAEEDLLDEEEKEVVPLNREKPNMNVGAQIVVVLCNTEKFGKNYPQSQADANKMFERALLHIRMMSLEIGAAIFTFASRRQGTTIKQYIDSVILGHKLTLEPQIANISLQELKEDQVILPAGFDSEKLLASSPLAKQKKSFEEVFPNKQKKKVRKGYEYKQESVHNDQNFLISLQLELSAAKRNIGKMEKNFAKMDKVMSLDPKVKKFMSDQLGPDMRRRSSMNYKKRKSGRVLKDVSRTLDRERLNRLNRDNFKVLGLIKPGK